MNINNNNPYANALDGLEIDDPVLSFFNFCKEREKIRLKREKKLSLPWSDDPIFQRGRFLNVFREDDRGSKAIIKFCSNTKDDLQKLIQALFFARWCNKQETLDKISAKDLSDVSLLRDTLLRDNQWCNLTAYPVEHINYLGRIYNRLDSATILFDKIKHIILKTILSSKGNVVTATNSINKVLMMDNNFPIFMAVIDISWFRPDIIDPKSHVPTGIGAVAYLNILQKYLNLENHNQACDKMISLQQKYWPEAKRKFNPIDIEYLSCECRKYYSYINKTKKFEGKNLFIPKF
jgi:hypothetical protein